MNQSIHILNQLGVITSFSVAKKVTDEDINKYFSKQKRNGKSEEQISEMLQDKILCEIHNAIENNEIPGLVTPQEFAKSLGMDKKVVEKIPELNRLIMVIAHKLAEKKYDKMSLCFFINSLVNMLGLTESDFTKFHRQNTTEDTKNEGPKGLDESDEFDDDESDDPDEGEF
jgi:predicted transcriptional regulator